MDYVKHMNRVAKAGAATTVVTTVVGVCCGWSLLKGIIVINAAGFVVGAAVGFGSALMEAKQLADAQATNQ